MSRLLLKWKKRSLQMVNYKSATSTTVSVGRYQITANPGLDLEVADKELDELVKSGALIKDTGVVEAPKSVPVVSTPTGTSK